jgi:PAS domain S-box-containing protein
MIMGAHYRFSLIHALGLLTLAVVAFVIAVAGLAMAGWIFGFGLFNQWFSSHAGHPGAIPPGLSPDAALCFILCGIALWALRETAGNVATAKAPAEKFLIETALLRASLVKVSEDEPEKQLESGPEEAESDKLENRAGVYSRRLAQLCASVAAAIAVATLAGFIFGWDASVGGWLAQLAAAVGHWSGQGALSARMAPTTAFAFLLNGVALTMLDVETRRGARPAQHLALVALFLSLVVALGHAYQISTLYNFFSAEGWPEMTALTAGIFVALSVGVVFARPRSGLVSLLTSQSAGGYVARRMLPAAILAPAALGWLRLFGEKAGYLNRPFGISLLVLSNILFFIILIWRSATALHNFDTERMTAETALYKAYTDLQRRVGEQTNELMRANQDLWAEMIERERVEEDLWRDRGETADAFETAPVCANRISPGGIILWANEADLKLLGYSGDEYVGHHLSEFHTDPLIVEEMLGLLLQGENLDNYEAILRAKDGSTRHVAVSSTSLWKDDNLVSVRLFTRDVTENRIIEETLLDSERNAWLEVERLEAMYQTSPTGMALVDCDLRYAMVNDVMGEMLNAIGALPVDRVINSAVREVSPRLADLTEAHFNQVLREGAPLLNVELRAVGAAGAGEERDWLISYAPLKDADDMILGVNVVALDVTGRKRPAGAGPVWSEGDPAAGRPQSIADSVPAMFWMSGEDKVLNFFSKGWLEYTGRTPDQEMENGWAEGIHPEDFERCLEAYVEAFNDSREFELEYRLRRHDGLYRWVLNHGAPRFHPDGTLAGYVGACVDIHERKEKEEALRARERASRGILESSADRIDALDLDGALVSINDRGIRLMGGDDVSAYAGAPWADLWEAEWREEARRAVETAKAGGKGHFVGSSKTAGGDLKWWSVIVCPSAGQGEAPEGLVAVLRDVTEAREIRNERDELLSRERAARGEAEDANRLKDEFLATVSHELRAPLNAIQGWVKLLRDGRLSPEEAARALETVERSTRAQNRIISDLLDVSRIITGKLRLNARAIHPAPVIEAVVESLRAAAEAKEIDIELGLDRDAGPISGDSDRLRQILWNLVSNAIKFSSKQGRVRVKLERVGSNVEISVSDNGVGIAADFLPYVFDRFRQGDSSSTRRQGGLGLGLAIVRHLTEMHGGSVTAESPGADQGATFTLRFPLVTQVPAKENGRKHAVIEAATFARFSASEVTQAPELGGLRVLAVDDDSDARDLIKTILTQCGAVVETAGSIGQALAVFERPEEWQPELLISDIEMPEADGYQLIRKLREIESQRDRRIPAIALTACARVEDRLRSLSAGFQMHVTKPVEPAELLTIVASLTGRLGRQRSLFVATEGARQEAG